MPTVPIDNTGASKRALVEGAYEYCGLNGFEYAKTPEEMVAGLRHLNAMLAEWFDDGIDLGYDQPTYGNGLLEELSGVPASATAVISQMLAQRLCPGLGGTLSDDAKAALGLSFQRLMARTAATPPSRSPAYKLPSSGVRHQRFFPSSDLSTSS